MDELRVTREWTFRGLKVIALENRYLRVHILPEAGAKIWQIIYKPLDTDLLWNNPRIAPARHPINARYDDVWSGGWDELFPNDECANIGGEGYPDHGELWTGEWDAEIEQSAGELVVHLKYVTPISSIEVLKKIVLPRDEPELRFAHSFTNLGQDDFPFLWKLHPAFKVTPQHRIDFPPMKVYLEPDFPGTLSGASHPFAWPYAKVGEHSVDLRQVRPESEKQLYFFYGTELTGGWCSLTNRATGLKAIIEFDPQIFSSCWLFATYGGWRNYNVAVLEPCTGYPLNHAAMQSAGRHKTLEVRQSFSTDVVFKVREGIHSGGDLDVNGKPTRARD